MKSSHCLWAVTALVFLTLCCSSNRQSKLHAQLRSTHAKLQRNTTPPKQSLDQIPNPEHVAAFQRAKAFHDLLELDRAIRLEVTDASIVTDASQIVALDGQWLVLDNPQNLVFRFADDGSYLGRISRKGQGPGEYSKAMHITPWKQGVAIVDSDRGNLLTFDRNGQYRKTLNTSEKGFFLTRPCLEIDNRLYLSSFQSVDSHIPLHLILNLEDQQPLWGFGRRIPHTEPVKHISFRSLLRKVDNTLWSGRPNLVSDINIYDLDGRLLRKVSSGIPSFNLNEFADLDDDRIREKSAERPQLLSIFPQGEFVVAIFSHYQNKGVVRCHTNVYDTFGNILKQTEPTTNPMLSFARGFTDTHIVVGIDISYVPLASIEKWILPHEMARLIEAGFDPEKRDNDNPWLLLYKLKPQTEKAQ